MCRHESVDMIPSVKVESCRLFGGSQLKASCFHREAQTVPCCVADSFVAGQFFPLIVGSDLPVGSLLPLCYF